LGKEQGPERQGSHVRIVSGARKACAERAETVAARFHRMDY
jgi:hypothetical protein